MLASNDKLNWDNTVGPEFVINFVLCNKTFQIRNAVTKLSFLSCWYPQANQRLKNLLLLFKEQLNLHVVQRDLEAEHSGHHELLQLQVSFDIDDLKGLDSQPIYLDIGQVFQNHVLLVVVAPVILLPVDGLLLYQWLSESLIVKRNEVEFEAL